MLLIEKPAPPPKKKRKKKEPPFIIPEWAKELPTLIEKVNEMKKYVSMSAELGLLEDFGFKSKEQLARFLKEIAFRKNEEETLRKLEEERAKKKKKGKK